jgi:KDO2-lipid IV(A) lauroyltransferase
MDRNEVLYLALRITSWLLPYVPLSVAYAMAAAAGRLAYFLVPSARGTICENLSVVFSESPTSRRVRRTALAVFQNDAKNWVDTLRIGQLSREDILDSVAVDGWHHLEAALSEGKGVILVTLHLGNFDLVGQVLAARGLNVTVPVEHMKPAKLFDFLLHQRISKGITLVPVERAPRAMLQALRLGQVVGVAGDRNMAGRVEWVDFFGKSAPMPRGPASLARHTGAPLLLAIGLRTGSSRYQGIITPPLELCASVDSALAERENTQRLAHAFEPFIKRFVDQWLVFSPIWPDPLPIGAGAGLARRSKAAV